MSTASPPSGVCVWLTGLSGSGKSTLAQALQEALRGLNIPVCVLDGDVVRTGLCSDLGFSKEDRTENIRRVAEVSRLMVKTGLTVVVALISPFRADRHLARVLFEKGAFIEVFVDASLEECQRRDPKGLYERVRRGEMKDFTGIDSPYEKPATPDVHLLTSETDVGACIAQILEALRKGGTKIPLARR